MNRVKKEEKYKKFLRDYKELGELRDLAREIHYIELEKPQFAGWEYSIGLDESGMRRRDAPDILFILDLLGLSKPYFIRNISTIVYLRKHRYHYYNAMKYYETGRYRSVHLHGFNYKKLIDEKQYLSLSEHYRKFFIYDEYESKYRYFTGNRYRFNWNAFPAYELKVKVRKAYWTKMGVHDTNAQTEYRKLDDKLDHNRLTNKYVYKSYPNKWDRKFTIRRNRRSMKMVCDRMREDSSEENEEYIMRICKSTNSSHYD
jgi:hypothetical protein